MNPLTPFGRFESEIPFGFQYYRAPTPQEREWEDDLRNIARMGFNTVKYWVQWRSAHREPHRFVFDDIDRLMDLAHQHGLKVVLNVIFDVAPTWFFPMYPSSKMITADGKVLEPAALSHRQLGGAPGPCYHHAKANEWKELFLKETVKHFRHHPAMYVWDLWNEPELTTGMKRELSFENQVCYCDSSWRTFQQWLRDKYQTIDRLNDKWQRDYANWTEVEAPRTQGVYNDMVDWRSFFVDTLTNEMRLRAEQVKELDMEHPVMCHTVPMPFFNPITCASDDFALAEPCDWFGNSVGSSAWAADLLKSAAKGKKLINSEIHALPGSTALKPKKLEWKELKKHILVPLARGITGFLFWQYRPELLGLEAPAWGTTYADGSVTPWLEDMARLNAMIQRNRHILANGERESDKVAILVSVANQITQFSVYRHLDFYNDSIQGIHQLLHDLNYKVEFIHENDATPETLAQYRCVWAPYPLYMNRELCGCLREWVENGGILISEYGFASIMAEQGMHSMRVPGGGFDEVFGVRERWCQSVELMDHSYHDATLEQSSRLVRVAALNEPGGTLYGAGYQSEIVCAEAAEVWAVFGEDDSPAVTCHPYGKGSAVWIGTLLGAGYRQHPNEEALRFWWDRLRRMKLEPAVQSAAIGVRVDWLDGRDPEDGWRERLLFVQNMQEEAAEVDLKLNGSFDSFDSWFQDESATLSGNRFCARLLPGDIQVYRLRFCK